MFQLSKPEFEDLILQIETSSWGGTRKMPLVFTEQGVAMLSSVLSSDRAVNVNIQIIRTFVKIRELLATNEVLQRKIMNLEKKYSKHDNQIKKVFDAINLLLLDENPPTGGKLKTEIGFKK